MELAFDSQIAYAKSHLGTGAQVLIKAEGKDSCGRESLLPQLF